MFLSSGNLFDYCVAVNQVGFYQTAFHGYLPFHQIRQDDAAVLTLNGHDVFHNNGFGSNRSLINSRKTHNNRLLFYIHAGKNHAQTHITFFEVGHSGHYLLKCSVIAGLIQLNGQISQLLCVGSIVTHHILHEGSQLLHGGMLTGACAAVAVMAAVVAVLVSSAVGVKMIVVMGVQMVVLMRMLMDMGVGGSVCVSVGVLVLMGVFVVVEAVHMIVMQMHSNRSFCFFYIITKEKGDVKTFILEKHPPGGVENREKLSYNIRQKGVMNMAEEKNALHTHAHMHGTADEVHAYYHANGIAHTHGHVHENQKAVINRLARAIGHLEKVKRMVEDGVDCSEVLVQLAAVRSALDNTGKVILKDHMRHCMVDAVAAGDKEAIDDLCEAIDKLMK